MTISLPWPRYADKLLPITGKSFNKPVENTARYTYSHIPTLIHTGKWFKPEQMFHLCQKIQQPIFGQFPAPLLDDFTSSTLAALLDQAVINIRANNTPPKTRWAFLKKLFGTIPDPQIKTHAIETPASPIDLKFIGKGCYAYVYDMQYKNHMYALKLYHHTHKAPDYFGPYGEIATGLYLSKFRFNNLSHFYSGNPKLGWALYEKIEAISTPSKRYGMPVKSHPNIELYDY